MAAFGTQLTKKIATNKKLNMIEVCCKYNVLLDAINKATNLEAYRILLVPSQN